MLYSPNVPSYLDVLSTYGIAEEVQRIERSCVMHFNFNGLILDLYILRVGERHIKSLTENGAIMPFELSEGFQCETSIQKKRQGRTEEREIIRVYKNISVQKKKVRATDWLTAQKSQVKFILTANRDRSHKNMINYTLIQGKLKNKGLLLIYNISLCLFVVKVFTVHYYNKEYCYLQQIQCVSLSTSAVHSASLWPFLH